MRPLLAAITLALTALFGFGASLSAEGNCPPGYYQTSATDFVGCVPLPAADQTPIDPGPQWASRFGAIATANGAFGVAENLSSARKAEKAAMKQCRANGGKDCSIILSFGNQCGAIAWGDTNVSSAAHEEVGEAENRAVKGCSTRTQNCKILYSACSYPERKR